MAGKWKFLPCGSCCSGCTDLPAGYSLSCEDTQGPPTGFELTIADVTGDACHTMFNDVFVCTLNGTLLYWTYAFDSDCSGTTKSYRIDCRIYEAFPVGAPYEFYYQVAIYNLTDSPGSPFLRYTGAKHAAGPLPCCTQTAEDLPVTLGDGTCSLRAV